MLNDLQAFIAAVRAGDYWTAFVLLGKLIQDVTSTLQSHGLKGQFGAKLAGCPCPDNIPDCLAALETEAKAASINWASVLQILLTIAKLLLPSL